MDMPEDVLTARPIRLDDYAKSIDTHVDRLTSTIVDPR
jgi:hypothetical protein